ncbi:MAG TPA: hypothetical protein P5309_11090 [Syntrophomonadaceae bacterium]|nr:hypothetical protein [Syntrophomonadaceae bacterium]
MEALKLIKTKQKIWADNHGIALIGSKTTQGEKIYTSSLPDNLFQSLSQATIENFKGGRGNEFGNGVDPGKMQALHSSSAVAVNAFEYWGTVNDKTLLAKSLLIPSGVISVDFEQKYPIFGGIPPHIDVVLGYENDFLCAIECKFTEPFNKQTSQSGLKPKYINDFSNWAAIPNIYTLAQKISPADGLFEKLDCAQLIKHILGLMTATQFDKEKFYLIYLYYGVFGEEGYLHEKEIERFSDVARSDGIAFQAITWQEFICNMYLNKTSDPGLAKYLEYMGQRYL